VRLADPVRADEAEALWHVGEALGESSNGIDSVRELLVLGIDLEVLEVAATVPRRDSRLLEEAASMVVAPAVAAHDTTSAVGFNGLPAGAIAEGADQNSDARKFGRSEAERP
jgi:hypothetical protein